MKKFLRDSGVPIALIVIKILTTLRTAADTFAISHDILNVALIDGAFLGLWILLAYGGDNAYAKRARPFATMGAWTLYIMMLIIGWDAHKGIVAIATRTAGGLGLLLDTWDYLAATAAPTIKRWQERRNLPPDVTQFGQRLMQNRLRGSVKHSVRSLKPHMDTLVLEQMRQALPGIVYGRMQNVMENPQKTIAITVESTRKPVIDRWGKVAPMLPSGHEFRRSDMQSLASCERSLASDLIKHGMNIGAIRRVAHGVYVYEVNHD